MSRRGQAAWLLAGLSLLSAGAAHATPAAFSGAGPRSQALGGAGLGLDLGYEAAFQNPAALVLSDRISLSAGYGVTESRLWLAPSGEAERRYPTEALHVTSLGFTLPLGRAAPHLVLGMASNSPSGFVTRASLPLAEQPQFPLLEPRLSAVDFDLGLGLRPLSWLALGAGLRALSTLSGTALVERDDSRTTAHVSDALKPVLAPIASTSVFVGGSSTLSLVFRAALRADFGVRLDAVDLGATELPALDLAGVAHYDPAQLQLEYGQELGAVRVLAGATYQRYRDAPPLLPRTVHCPVQRPDCQALDTDAPELHDTLDLHLAGTWDLKLARSARLELRAGYAYVPSPVPEQTRASNLLDASRQRLSFGYGVEWSEPWPELAFDLAGFYDHLQRRSHHKASDVDPDNAGFPGLASRGALFGATLGLTLRLE